MNLPEFLVDHPDGEIQLAGHRIGLYTVIRLAKEGRSPDEIHAELPTLETDLIRRVIAFYHANLPEVDRYVDQYAAELDRLAALPPRGPSLDVLRQRLEERRRAGVR